jgi:glycine cleavage system H protein
MSDTPSNLSYTKEHEWVEDLGNGKYRIGITDYAQSALGDIVYIQLPKLEQEVVAGSVCGEVESTKSVSEIYAPISGKVVSINSDLDSAPEKINSEPYANGWIAEIQMSADFDIKTLLTAEDYQKLTA